MSSLCIQTRDLSKVYEGKLALNRVDLDIRSGGVNAIVGSNGAGKSTLFKVLLGMITPSFGEATILGCDASKLDRNIRQKVGYVNEEHSLPDWMRVDQVIAFQRQFYPQWDESLFASVLGYFNVNSKQKITSLSRGERAGVNLALAFAQKPELLILDEPTLGLDVIAKQSFLEAILFTELNYQTTFIYCSHQMEEVQRVADNLIVMEQGQIQHNNDPDSFSDRVSNLIVERFSNWQTLREHPKVLKINKLDDLLHIWVLDNDGEIESLLASLDAQLLNRQAANLEQAVNAFLTRKHSAPKFALGEQA